MLLATVLLQDMYQFVVTLDKCELPFTLHAVLPRQQIPVSKSGDLLSYYSLKGSTVMVEDASELDIDTFLDTVCTDIIYICRSLMTIISVY